MANMSNTTKPTASALSAELRQLTAFVTLPGGRGKTSVRTLQGWITRGVHAGSKTIYLRAERIGGSWRTSEAMLDAFFNELTATATANRKPQLRSRRAGRSS